MTETPSSGLTPQFNLGEHIASQTPGPDEVENHAVAAANRLLEGMQTLEREANTDELTGLLNRKAWERAINEDIEAGKEFGVIFVDLSNFKGVNDIFGHLKGDETLREYATVLKSTFRTNNKHEHPDLIAHERMISPRNGVPGRVGGDEFKIKVDLHHEANGPEELTLTQRMQGALRHLRESSDEFVGKHPDLQSIGFDVAIGAAIWEPGMDVAELLTTADMAMYDDKEKRKAEKGIEIPR